MSEYSNGFSAFPWVTEDRYNKGMTLRDYFAAKAMHGLLTHPRFGTEPASKIADYAYEQADAMLAKRREDE